MDILATHLDPDHPHALSHPTTLVFANYRDDPRVPDLVLPAPPSSDGPAQVRPFQRARPPHHTASLFSPKSRLSTALRYSRYVACFNLYPASARDLRVNDLLWTIAQTGEYDPASANLLLENNILALAMPEQFHAFLCTTTRAELRLCMLEVLALIADDEDVEGLNLMKFELEASVWSDLEAYIHPSINCSNNNHNHTNDDDIDNGEGSEEQRRKYTPRLDPSTERGAKLSRDVDMLLRLCHLSPWKIEVHASFVSPRDMRLVLNDLSASAAVAATLLHPLPQSLLSLHSYSPPARYSPGTNESQPLTLAAVTTSFQSGLNTSSDQNLVDTTVAYPVAIETKVPTTTTGALMTTTTTTAAAAAAAAAATVATAATAAAAAAAAAATAAVTAVADRPLVRSAARRPVSSLGARAIAALALQSRLSNKKLALWKQFQSWRRYRDTLVAMCGMEPKVVSAALLVAIGRGAQDEVLRRVETVLDCASVRGNMLSRLPQEVVFRMIAPQVLLTG